MRGTTTIEKTSSGWFFRTSVCDGRREISLITRGDRFDNEIRTSAHIFFAYKRRQKNQYLSVDLQDQERCTHDEKAHIKTQIAAQHRKALRSFDVIESLRAVEKRNPLFAELSGFGAFCMKQAWREAATMPLQKKREKNR